MIHQIASQQCHLVAFVGLLAMVGGPKEQSSTSQLRNGSWSAPSTGSSHCNLNLIHSHQLGHQHQHHHDHDAIRLANSHKTISQGLRIVSGQPAAAATAAMTQQQQQQQQLHNNRLHHHHHKRNVCQRVVGPSKAAMSVPISSLLRNSDAHNKLSSRHEFNVSVESRAAHLDLNSQFQAQSQSQSQIDNDDDATATATGVHFGAKLSLFLLAIALAVVALATLIDLSSPKRAPLAGMPDSVRLPKASFVGARRTSCKRRRMGESALARVALRRRVGALASGRSSPAVSTSGSSSSYSSSSCSSSTSSFNDKVPSKRRANQTHYKHNIQFLFKQMQHHHFNSNRHLNRSHSNELPVEHEHEHKVEHELKTELIDNDMIDSQQTTTSDLNLNSNSRQSSILRASWLEFALRLLDSFSLCRSAAQIFGYDGHAHQTSRPKARNKRAQRQARDAQDTNSLHGLRFLSMIWVIVMHSYSFALNWLTFTPDSSPHKTLYLSVTGQFLFNGSFACDTFLLIGGFLLTYLAIPSAANRCPKSPELKTGSRGRPPSKKPLAGKQGAPRGAPLRPISTLSRLNASLGSLNCVGRMGFNSGSGSSSDLADLEWKSSRDLHDLNLDLNLNGYKYFDENENGNGDANDNYNVHVHGIIDKDNYDSSDINASHSDSENYSYDYNCDQGDNDNDNNLNDIGTDIIGISNYDCDHDLAKLNGKLDIVNSMPNPSQIQSQLESQLELHTPIVKCKTCSGFKASNATEKQQQPRQPRPQRHNTTATATGGSHLYALDNNQQHEYEYEYEYEYQCQMTTTSFASSLKLPLTFAQPKAIGVANKLNYHKSYSSSNLSSLGASSGAAPEVDAARKLAPSDSPAIDTCSLRKVLKNLLHRYVRMVPLMMAIIGLNTSFLRYFGAGPNWDSSTEMFDSWCRKNWYLNALSLHNFVDTNHMCLSHSWYSAVDMQLFTLGQLLLVVLVKNKRLGLGLCALLIAASQLITGLKTYLHELPPIPELANFSQEQMVKYYGQIYIKPYCRASPYLIGMIFAYLMRTTRLPSYHLTRAQILTGWLLALTTLAAIVIAPQPVMNGQMPGRLALALYSCLSRPLWSCAIAWVIYASMTKRGGWVANFLAARCFIPFSRLNYSVFLIHPVVIAVFYGSQQGTFHFSHYLMTYLILGNVVITYGCAFVLSSLFELPIMSIERLLKNKNKNKTQSQSQTQKSHK